MQLPWRRKKLKDQRYARAMIEDGIEHGDPTQWGVFKDRAGYDQPGAGDTFARYLISMAEHHEMPDANRKEILDRAAQLKAEARALEGQKPKKGQGLLFFRGQRV